MDATKGFITIATGKDQYYILAHNLLLSYRYHNKSQVPFVILCDRENEWTTRFDQVVIMDNPARALSDKLRILDLSPFDETIFLDADCLVYRDLSPLWNLFRGGPDLGLLGYTFPLNSDKGWWDIKDLGQFQDKVDYKMTCQGGVYYVRKKGKDLPAFRETCQYIQAHYTVFKFRIFPTVIEDETILSLASCVHHYLPVKNWADIFAYFPVIRLIAHDILSGTIEFECTEFQAPRYKDSFLIHFGTAYAANRWAYKKDVFKLKKGPICFSNMLDYCLLRLGHSWGKIKKTILRLLGIQYELKIYA